MRFPYRYVVVKFLQNRDRDEPINIGIIIQSREGDSRARFLGDLESRLGGAAPGVAKLVMAHVQGLTSQYSKDATESQPIEGGVARSISLDYLHERHVGNVQFSEPMATGVIDVDEEIEYLFDKYVARETPVRKRERKSLLRSLLRQDLKENSLLASRRHTGFSYKETVNVGFSKAPLTLDFVFRNGSLYVLETVDGTNRLKLSQQVYEAAFKFDDLRQALGKKVQTMCAYSFGEDVASDDDKTNFLKIINAYSTGSYDYDNGGRKKLLRELRGVIGL